MPPLSGRRGLFGEWRMVTGKLRRFSESRKTKPESNRRTTGRRDAHGFARIVWVYRCRFRVHPCDPCSSVGVALQNSCSCSADSARA